MTIGAALMTSIATNAMDTAMMHSFINGVKAFMGLRNDLQL